MQSLPRPRFSIVRASVERMGHETAEGLELASVQLVPAQPLAALQLLQVVEGLAALEPAIKSRQQEVAVDGRKHGSTSGSTGEQVTHVPIQPCGSSPDTRASG